ncbi:MAG: hypothetical protein GXO50_00490 [Chlorobi bacterium]|nr:hypothetical protein [Chlorobiota bacterium]
MKLTTIIYAIIITAFTISSCNTQNNNKNNIETTEKTNTEEHLQSKLLNIPLKTEEETKRFEINPDIIAIDVFGANIAMNEGTELLKKMFPEAKITPGTSSEVFDSFNIENNNNRYCGIITYKQNDKEEFVTKTIYISKGFFNEDIAEKILSQNNMQ